MSVHMQFIGTLQAAAKDSAVMDSLISQSFNSFFENLVSYLHPFTIQSKHNRSSKATLKKIIEVLENALKVVQNAYPENYSNSMKSSINEFLRIVLNSHNNEAIRRVGVEIAFYLIKSLKSEYLSFADAMKSLFNYSAYARHLNGKVDLSVDRDPDHRIYICDTDPPTEEAETSNIAKICEHLRKTREDEFLLWWDIFETYLFPFIYRQVGAKHENECPDTGFISSYPHSLHLAILPYFQVACSHLDSLVKADFAFEYVCACVKQCGTFAPHDKASLHLIDTFRYKLTESRALVRTIREKYFISIFPLLQSLLMAADTGLTEAVSILDSLFRTLFPVLSPQECLAVCRQYSDWPGKSHAKVLTALLISLVDLRVSKSDIWTAVASSVVRDGSMYLSVASGFMALFGLCLAASRKIDEIEMLPDQALFDRVSKIGEVNILIKKYSEGHLISIPEGKVINTEYVSRDELYEISEVITSAFLNVSVNTRPETQLGAYLVPAAFIDSLLWVIEHAPHYGPDPLLGRYGPWLREQANRGEGIGEHATELIGRFLSCIPVEWDGFLAGLYTDFTARASLGNPSQNLRVCSQIASAGYPLAIRVFNSAIGCPIPPSDVAVVLPIFNIALNSMKTYYGKSELVESLKAVSAETASLTAIQLIVTDSLAGIGTIVPDCLAIIGQSLKGESSFCYSLLGSLCNVMPEMEECSEGSIKTLVSISLKGISNPTSQNEFIVVRQIETFARILCQASRFVNISEEFSSFKSMIDQWKIGTSEATFSKRVSLYMESVIDLMSGKLLSINDVSLFSEEVHVKPDQSIFSSGSQSLIQFDKQTIVALNPHGNFMWSVKQTCLTEPTEEVGNINQTASDTSISDQTEESGIPGELNQKCQDSLSGFGFLSFDENAILGVQRDSASLGKFIPTMYSDLPLPIGYGTNFKSQNMVHLFAKRLENGLISFTIKPNEIYASYGPSNLTFTTVPAAFPILAAGISESSVEVIQQKSGQLKYPILVRGDAIMSVISDHFASTCRLYDVEKAAVQII